MKKGEVAMSNDQDWYDEIEDDSEEMFEDYSDKPKRRANGDDVVSKLRRSDRSKEKRIKELESELTSLRKTQRDSTVKSVLESKGISPKISAFIPQDIDVSSSEFDSWLSEYADVFGVTPEPTSSVNEMDLAALRQIDAVTAGASSPDRNEDMYLRLNQAESAEEILNMIYGAE